VKREILWLFLSCLMVLTLVAWSCDGTPSGEQQEEEEEEEGGTGALVDGYQIAEANELRTELGALLGAVVDTGIEVVDYCDTFWETWRDGTKEEMLQLADDYPNMVTRVAEAKSKLNDIPTIIDEVEELDIPAWYQDYFSEKEQVADHLATACQQIEAFLTEVEPMVANMSDFMSVGEGILDFWDSVIPEIGALIDEENYSQARQRVATAADSVDDMESLLMSAYNQAEVPILMWFSDRCSSLEGVLILVTDWLEAKEAGNVAQAEQLKNEILDICYEELEILESIPWEESNNWFETNFGSYVDEAMDSLSQAVSLNNEAELAYEANWTPLEGAPMFDAAETDATGNVCQMVYKETDDTYYWETGDTVGGHPEVDIVGAHTRQEEDTIIFWMEVVGPIVDDYDLSYSFDVRTTLHGERLLEVEYSAGEAECYLPTTGDFISCEYLKSDTALIILVPVDVVDTPAGWSVSANVDDWRELEWNETYTRVLSGGWYTNSLQLTSEE